MGEMQKILNKMRDLTDASGVLLQKMALLCGEFDKAIQEKKNAIPDKAQIQERTDGRQWH